MPSGDEISFLIKVMSSFLMQQFSVVWEHPAATETLYRWSKPISLEKIKHV